MQKIVITGGRKLKGSVRVAGAKNAALPILASSLLVAGKSLYRNVPRVGDVETMLSLLSALGAKITSGGHRVAVDGTQLRHVEAGYEAVNSMRASVLVLGPLLARFGEARVSMPSGCAIGARPIDQHLKGLQALGAKIELEHGVVVAKAKRLHGAMVVFDLVTVSGTANVMMAATLAKGHTTIENAACEPEVEELACVLNKMGARISGAGTSTINIVGVSTLHPIDHAIIPDRIEAGTFLIAGAMTRGNVLVQDCVPEHLAALMAKLRAAGAELTVEPGGVRVRGFAGVEPTDVATRPYPAFPSDLQPPFMAFMTCARGESVLSETVFENRFLHVPELQRMGADIALDGRMAVVRGRAKLNSARVLATDVRAGAALVLAGLVARGPTEVHGVYHLDRGYEAMEKKLRALGADIRRAKAKGQ